MNEKAIVDALSNSATPVAEIRSILTNWLARNEADRILKSLDKHGSELVSAAYAADHLGVTLRRVHALIKSKRLKAIRFGKSRTWWIHKNDLMSYEPLPQGWRKGRRRNKVK